MTGLVRQIVESMESEEEGLQKEATMTTASQYEIEIGTEIMTEIGIDTETIGKVKVIETHLIAHIDMVHTRTRITEADDDQIRYET